MAIVDTDYPRVVRNADMMQIEDIVQENGLWAEEPARMTDYLVFLGVIAVSFLVLGTGFWALFSHFYPAA
ncbi:MAG: hypothetical protein GC184_03215 [Rhizobiales bacterium]|nr:hypothetical protein [Hyphomicrobiales bacterium]